MCAVHCWHCKDRGYRRTWGGDVVCPANCEAAVRYCERTGQKLWPPFDAEAST